MFVSLFPTKSAGTTGSLYFLNPIKQNDIIILNKKSKIAALWYYDNRGGRRRAYMTQKEEEQFLNEQLSSALITSLSSRESS